MKSCFTGKYCSFLHGVYWNCLSVIKVLYCYVLITRRCLILVCAIYFLSALLIPPEHEGFGVLDLMWIVIVSDYVLKLATVLLKTVITIMPHSFMHYQNRVSFFLLIALKMKEFGIYLSEKFLMKIENK